MVDDTSPEARRVQREAFRRMGPSGRIDAVVELSEVMRAITRAGIEASNPNWEAARVEHELRCRLWGADLAEEVARHRGGR